MNNLACAVTSSAMILNYHQFSNSPTGDVTSPATLNNYLIDRGGYTKKGGLIWSYITKYAKESQEAGFADPSLKLLEFTYPNYSPEGLQDKIAQNNPSILKTQLSGEDTPTASDDSYHFIVAKGVVLPTTYINDPWDLTDIGSTLPDKYPNKPITKIAQFTKSHTDLSYIWVYHYNPLVNLIVDSNGLKTGTDQANQIFSQIPDAQYFSEGTLASLTPEPVPTNQHVQLFLLPKPTNDQYLLTFSSQSFQKDSPEIYLFDKDANDTKYFLNTTNLPNYTQTIELDFSTTPTIQQIATFSSLKELILATYESGWIGNVNTKDQLYRFVEVAESVYPKEPESGIDIVNAFLTHLHNTHKQTKINDSAYSLLSIETNLLLNQL
jgi:hypothetical protein